MGDCKFCEESILKEVLFENEYCIYVEHPSKILQGSGMIITKKHRETVFDMTEEEIVSTFQLLNVIKEHIDFKFKPNGYNIGWNCYEVGGQTVAHVHLHVIPRYEDEPLAGKGIRHHIKQPENTRVSLIDND